MNKPIKFAYENNRFFSLHKVVLLTDLGNGSFELVQIKAAVLSSPVDYQLIELSNEVIKYDITEAHFFINTVWQNFLGKVLFVISVGIPEANGMGYIIAKCGDKVILAPDNGFIPLLTADYKTEYFMLNEDAGFEETLKILLQDELTVTDKFTAFSNPVRKMFEKPPTSNTTLRAKIIHIDSFGNAYIPVSKTMFDEHTQGKPFEIVIQRDESIFKISKGYKDVSDVDTLAYFDESNSYLIIAVKLGNASQLLALRKGHYIIIENSIK